VIVVAEPQCTGLEHVEVNAALLVAVRLAFPDEELLFLAEDAHGGLVREKAAGRLGGGVVWQPLAVPPRNLSDARRLPAELHCCRQVFRHAAARRARAILFCSVTSPGMYAIGLNLAVTPGPTAYLVLHNQLETVEERPSPVPWRFPFRVGLPLRLARTARFRPLVFGDFIRDALTARGIGGVQAIEHPYLFREPPPWQRQPGATVRFATFGFGHASKGTDRLFALAAEIGAAAPGAAEFYHIGAMADPTLAERGGVIVPSPAAPLAREEYDRYADLMDYALFFYPPGMYRYSASGALLDALSHGKPIIALRNPFFSHCFGKMGDIGYLCDSYGDLRDRVAAVVGEFPQEHYRRQRQNILDGRVIFSPAGVAGQLQAVMGEGGGR